MGLDDNVVVMLRISISTWSLLFYHFLKHTFCGIREDNSDRKGGVLYCKCLFVRILRYKENMIF